MEEGAQDVQLDARAVRSVTANAAEDFFRRYFYPAADKARHEMGAFYRAESVLVWNGTQYAGVHDIDQLVRSLPPSKHTLHSIDCHPVAITQPLAYTNMTQAPPMITAMSSGTVAYASSSPRLFHHQFILALDRNTRKFFILQEAFRLLE